MCSGKRIMKFLFAALVWGMALLVSLSACGNNTSSAPATTQPSTAQSCNKPTTVSPASKPGTLAQAQGSTGNSIATGMLDNLPPGPQFMNTVLVPQPAGNTITHAHVAGFVYVTDGTQILAFQNGPRMILKTGNAAFIGTNVPHSHINPGTTTNQWLFLSLRPSTERNEPPLFPNQKTLFASPDIRTLSPGAYCENLRFVAQQPGGREAAYMHSGVETVLVLDGLLRVARAGLPPVTLTRDQGVYTLPNVPVQEFNAGSAPVHFLDFTVYPKNQPFRSNVTQSP
jgi:quercetin dioxygenase-like cupin family protein